MEEEKRKKIEWEDGPEISEEEIARMLEERPGGRKAGRGDSEYTQEYYEKLYGIKKKKEERPRSPLRRIPGTIPGFFPPYPHAARYNLIRKADSGSMHEASVTADIADAVMDELSRRSVKKVNEVTIVVGDLTMLLDEQMQFAWEVLSQGTPLEGSVLTIKHEPIEVKCEACGYEGPVRNVDLGGTEAPLLSCPECGGRIEVVKGSACRIESFDIEE